MRVFINAIKSSGGGGSGGTLGEAAALACDLHLELRAGISWLIDPLKGHAGRLPTPVVDGSTCGAKKELLFSEPPPHGKTDIGGENGVGGTSRVVRYQWVDLFFKKQPLFSLCHPVARTHTQRNERKKKKIKKRE